LFGCQTSHRVQLFDTFVILLQIFLQIVVAQRRQSDGTAVIFLLVAHLRGGAKQPLDIRIHMFRRYNTQNIGSITRLQKRVQMKMDIFFDVVDVGVEGRDVFCQLIDGPVAQKGRALSAKPTRLTLVLDDQSISPLKRRNEPTDRVSYDDHVFLSMIKRHLLHVRCCVANIVILQKAGHRTSAAFANMNYCKEFVYRTHSL